MPKTWKTISQREFGPERVPADGKEFSNCTFKNTVLVFAGRSEFIVANCTGNMTVAFTGAAETTLNQLAAMHRFGFAGHVEAIFQQIRNPLGEVSH